MKRLVIAAMITILGLSMYSDLFATVLSPCVGTVKFFEVQYNYNIFQFRLTVNGEDISFFSDDLSSAKTKAIMATVMSAYTNGWPVTVEWNTVTGRDPYKAIGDLYIGQQ